MPQAPGSLQTGLSAALVVMRGRGEAEEGEGQVDNESGARGASAVGEGQDGAAAEAPGRGVWVHGEEDVEEVAAGLPKILRESRLRQ